MLDGAAAGGWQASGVEAREDGIELDGNAPALFHSKPDDLANRFIFAGNRPLVQTVTSLGLVRVEQGQHVFRRPFEAAYKLALGQLLA